MDAHVYVARFGKQFQPILTVGVQSFFIGYRAEEQEDADYTAKMLVKALGNAGIKVVEKRPGEGSPDDGYPGQPIS